MPCQPMFNKKGPYGAPNFFITMYLLFTPLRVENTFTIYPFIGV